MKNYQKLGLISAHTGQVVLTNPVDITKNWSQSSTNGEGVSFWGEGAPEIASLLVDETSLQIDKMNNWYRITQGITPQQLREIANSMSVAVHIEALRGDKMFDILRDMNETPAAGGSLSGGAAVTCYFEVGMYPVYYGEDDKNVVIGKKEGFRQLACEDLGELMTSGPLLICDPANIRLHDYEVEGEDNILPHIHDLISQANGGQLTFTALQVQEFFIVCKVTPGLYRAEGYYELDSEGLRVYRTLILQPAN